MKVFARVVVIVVAIGLLSGGAALAAPLGKVEKTAIHHFKPFTPSGAVRHGYRVTATASGYCWTSSSASNRKDAYRCFRGNEIFDPCFSNPVGSRVACMRNGNPKTHLLLLKLTKRLPKSANRGRAQAWLLGLGDGVRCGFLTGATYAVNGQRANYGCTNRLTLFGHPKHGRSPWLIRAGRGLHPHLHWVGVADAWI